MVTQEKIQETKHAHGQQGEIQDDKQYLPAMKSLSCFKTTQSLDHP